MPKRRIVDIRSEVPLFDVASYGRRGPGDRVPSKLKDGCPNLIRRSNRQYIRQIQ